MSGDLTPMDKWLRRLKDLCLLGAVIWALFSGSMDFYGIPKKVEAHSSELSSIDKRLAATDLRIQAV